MDGAGDVPDHGAAQVEPAVVTTAAAAGYDVVLHAVMIPLRLSAPRVAAQVASGGHDVPEEKLAHLSPLGWDHITLTGIYHWDLTATSSLEQLLVPQR